MSIRLVTLGQLSVYRDGAKESSILSWRRRLAILAYMGVEREATRDQLTVLFWPEKNLDRARHSLSQALYEIRQACGAECLLSRGNQVRASPDLVVDAAEFRSLAESGDHQEALKHYGGLFLSGVHLAGTPEFEHWVERTQARLRRLHRVSRDTVIREHMAHDRLDAALPVARRWVELEPFEDEAQHRFIELLSLEGRRSEALQQYETFERSLAQQDLEPLEETRILVEGIRTGEERGSLTTLPPPSAIQEEAPTVESPQQVPGEATVSSGGEDDSEPGDPLRELIQALKERWVFRAALTYAAALFVWIQVGDALIGVFDVPQITILRVTTLSLAAFPGLVILVWALEPWLRSRKTLNGSAPRKVPAIPFHLTRKWRGMGAVFAVAGSTVLGFALWPAGPPEHPLAEEPALATTRHSFAIIPILPEDSTNAFLAGVSDHLTRTLINYFRDFDVLNVPSLERVSAYSRDRPPPDSILQHLGVEILLTGWIGERGDSVLVSLDLERPGMSGDHIQTMVSRGRNLNELELVRRVSSEISGRLRLNLRGEFLARELRLGTSNPRAWQLAQQGEDEGNRARAALNGRQLDILTATQALEAADSLFQLASEEDPSWPDPHILRGYLSVVWVSLAHLAVNLGLQPPVPVTAEDLSQIVKEGLGEIEEGLALHPSNREGLVREAEVLRALSFYVEDSDSLESLERRRETVLQGAIAGDPPRPDAMFRLARLRFEKGDYSTALDLYETAFGRDVFRQRLPSDLLDLGRLRLETGRADRGLQECAAAEERATGWDRYMLHECELLLLAFGNGIEPDVQGAQKLIMDSTLFGAPMGGSEGGPNPRLLTLYAAVLARAGLPDSARAVHGRALALRPDPPMASEYDVGVFAILGDTARAFQILREQSNLHLNSVIFDPLRRYPVFDSLLRAPDRG